MVSTPHGSRKTPSRNAIEVSATGMPIVPVAINVGWKISVKSWDRFQIPLPFSRCEMIYGQPIQVPRETSETEREAFRAQVEKALRDSCVD